MSEFQRALARSTIADVTAADALIFDVDIDTEDFGDALCPQHLARCAERDEIALVHHRDAVAEHCGMVQVMQGGHDCQFLAADKIKQPDLVPDIEMIGRFVQKQNPRLLRQARAICRRCRSPPESVCQ